MRLISPQFVTPYVKSNKNDRNDAEAICEAVGRPSMRFVPPKSPDQLRTSIYPSSAGFGALTAHRKRVTGTLSLGLAPVLGITA